MPARDPDPYRTLGVSPGVSDAELRRAYRRLVQQHHPDHNAGSAESARRFEAIQTAYAQINELRKSAPPGGQPRPRPGADPDVEARLAELERQLRAANAARERARRAAREAAVEGSRRPSDAELGYVSTDDSLAQILADARTELANRFAQVRQRPVAKRLDELIDELAAKLTGEHRGP